MVFQSGLNTQKHLKLLWVNSEENLEMADIVEAVVKLGLLSDDQPSLVRLM